ncbi:MAG: hypothetical protein EOP54_11650 [Sphingobacteriales bacterium]|nr:MAG: hypothetical protein EOP54_11650 [Sphingobacteriales bacterium]
MNLHQTITVLEALASGCSPATGAMVAGESVLNERDVIRALQVAIEQLKNEPPGKQPGVKIDPEDIHEAIRLFKEHQQAASPQNLAGFFLATKAFKQEPIRVHALYGKYKDLYANGQLQDFFTAWLQDNKTEEKPWKGIDFFQQPGFNHYTATAIDQLKQQVSALGLSKRDHLVAYIQKARLHYPRSHEPWKAPEDELLWAALQQTNELSLLSDCFQRGANAIEERAKRLLYAHQNGVAKL